MSIRTKLLILVLGLVLGVVGVNAVLTLHDNSKFARTVSDTARVALKERGDRELEGVVSGFRRVIGAQKWASELALLAIAEEARALLSDAPKPRRDEDHAPIFVGQLGRTDFDLRPLPEWNRPLFQDGEAFSELLFRVPDDADAESYVTQAERLQPIVRTFRILDQSAPALDTAIGLRYIALDTGLLAMYPATTKVDRDPEAPDVPWYDAAKRFAVADEAFVDFEGPVLWNRLTFDRVTERVVMTGTIPLKDAEGLAFGVAAIDIAVETILAGFDPPGELDGKISSKIVVPIPRETDPAAMESQREKIRVRTGVVTELDESLIEHGGLLIIAERFPLDDEPIAGAPRAAAAEAKIEDEVNGNGDAAEAERREFLDVRHVVANGPDATEVTALIDAMLASDVGTMTTTFGGDREASAWAWGKIGGDTFVAVSVPEAHLVREAEQVSDQFNAEERKRIYTTIMIAIAVGAAAAAIALVAARRLVRPLLELRAVAERIAAGDFEARATVRTGDEIERLGQTFNDMVPQLADRMRLRESISVAMQVQQHLLPSKPPELPGLEVIAKSIYCDETGGDYFDFVPLNGAHRARTIVAVGDVTGHGIAAALVMASARAILRSRTVIDDDLAVVASAMNEQLFRDSLDGRFMTLFVLEIDRATRALTWVSAGHEPALLYDPTADAFEELRGRDIPLGVEPGWTFRACARPAMTPGQLLLLGTDGIWETRGPDGELFGKERLCQIVRDHAHEPIANLQTAIEAALHAHRSGKPQQDDVTFVALRALSDA